MSTAELETAVQVLQDCLGSLSQQQSRLEEANTYLERRLHDLERRFGTQQPPAGCDQVLPESSTKKARKEGQEEKEEEDPLLVDHSLGETLWEAVVIVGLPELSWSGSVLLFASMLLNAFVQVYICAMLQISGDFIQPDRFSDLEVPMRQWRLSSAHELSNLDTAGRSLATRVCGDDQSLSLAVNQVDLLAEINSYLSLEIEDLELTGFGTGPLLCLVCILLFTVVVLKDLRSLASCMKALLSLPRGATRLDGGRLVAISASRLACVLVTNAVRAGIAVTLLYTGVMWLSSTTSITDLILNAAALGFVMDLDEYLFETTTPAVVHELVKRLEPLKYKRSRWSLEAVVPLAAIGLVVFTSWPLVIIPNVVDMLEVKRALCGGNLQFATVQNPAGYVASRATADLDADVGTDLKAKANDELISSAQLGRQIPQFSSWQAILTMAQGLTDTIENMARQANCNDTDDGPGGFYTVNMPFKFTAARYETGIHAGESLAERDFRCRDYAAACGRSNLLRNVCPVTCGCDDPHSGLMFANEARGCPVGCQALRSQRLLDSPCTDMNSTNSEGWSRYFNSFLEIAGQVIFDESTFTAYQEMVSRKMAEGCDNTEGDIQGGFDNFCDDSHWFFTMNGMSSVSPFCPARCCRGGGPLRRDCPPSCR